jgi:hypothetical protein
MVNPLAVSSSTPWPLTFAWWILQCIPPRAAKALPARCCEALQTHAAQTGRSLSLAVAKTNAGARQLYDALGFALQSEDLIVEQRMWRAHSAR